MSRKQDKKLKSRRAQFDSDKNSRLHEAKVQFRYDSGGYQRPGSQNLAKGK